MNKHLYSKLIFELSQKGRCGYNLPDYDYSCKAMSLPETLLRGAAPELPEVDEPTVVRHYINSSNNNFGVDTGFYPLGSCTMKYNPKVNEAMVARSGIAGLHPAQSIASVQGALRVYRTLEKYLAEIGGMAEFTLNPFAGAHGEYCGLMVIRAYHQSRADVGRTKVIVPVSAHGTNPASASMAGFDIIEVECLADGTVNLDDFRSKLDATVAAVMLTNPNT
ncbi:MAG: aminomethyl-transferring glycine dehydrogenase subunit GcvPB, partial [Muribaculaceae bacterium]|nr:aminomethyl-transferring glycine dehydrogenase subunit GcvPB [Muribaculaceae bacterium]